MRHTSGQTYGISETRRLTRCIEKADIIMPRLYKMVKTIARLPLLHQPGEYWEYSMDLDNFVRERITGPLKMNDTGFWVKPAASSRLAKPDGEPNAAFADETKKPALFSGGGGMLSTSMDYARFCQMLLNRGELDSVRVLATKTVALMTSDQLPPGAERHTSGDIARRIWSRSGNGHQLQVASRFVSTPAAIRCRAHPTFPGAELPARCSWSTRKKQARGCADGADSAAQSRHDLETDANHGLSGDD